MDTLLHLHLRLQEMSHHHGGHSEAMRGSRVPYVRRGELSVPAFKMAPGGDPQKDGREASLRLMRKAATLPVDFLFYDLEDAAPDQPQFKSLAREFVVQALLEGDFAGKVVAFRPNNIRSAHFADDVLTVVGRAGHRLHALVLPKSESVDEVREVGQVVRDLQRLNGRDNRIMLEVLVESPRALVCAEQVAALPDVAALILGPYDLMRTIGGRVDPQHWLTDLAAVRQLLPLWAAAHGKDAVDGITGTLPIRPPRPQGLTAQEFEDLLAGAPAPASRDGLTRAQLDAVAAHQAAVALCQRDAMDARRLGFAAKWILHPDQVAAVQDAFTPTRELALTALNLAASYARSATQGHGALAQGQVMVDKAVVGAQWWEVECALRGGVLKLDDVAATGLDLEVLRRSVRAR